MNKTYIIATLPRFKAYLQGKSPVYHHRYVWATRLETLRGARDRPIIALLGWRENKILRELVEELEDRGYEVEKR